MKQLKKTVVATFVASLCNTAAWAALPDLTITNSSPTEIEVPNNGQLNSIIIDTTNQDINHEISIGNINKPIADLNVALGLDRNNSKGGGKVSLNIFANSAIFGGHGINLDYVQTVGHPSIEGSKFNFYVDTLTSHATKEGYKKFQALSVGSNSTILVKASGDIHLEASDNNALYVDERAQANINANSIVLTANRNGTFAPVITITSDGIANLTAQDSITLTNNYSGSSYGIQLNQAGQINLVAKNSITILGDKRQKSLHLNQTAAGAPGSTTNGTISLSADDIALNGYIYSSMNDKVATNGIFLNANNNLVIQAKVDDAGAIHNTEKGFVSVAASEFSIINESDHENSVGIFLEKKQAEFQGTFKTSAIINATNGIYIKDSGAKFALSGDSSQKSLLTINSELAGVISKGEDVSFKDTSLSINLTKNDNLKDKWYSPIGTSGIAGIHGIDGNVDFTNTDATGKTLAVTVTANANTNSGSGESELKTSAISAMMNGKINIQNFEDVNLAVYNTGSKASNYGLRSVSGIISITEGIGKLNVMTNDGSAVYSSSFSGYQAGQVNIKAQQIELQSLGSKGIGINANDDGCVNLVAIDKLSIIANKTINVESANSNVTIDAEKSQLSNMKGDWSVNAGKATVALGTSSLVQGKLQATSKGTIDLSLDKSSIFKGSTSTGLLGTGTVNLTAGEGSVWNVTDNSHATALDLTGTTIDFSRWELASNTGRANLGYRSITAKSFLGNNDTLRMQIDLANETKDKVLTDQLNITGQALGTHTADLKIDGKDLVPNKFHSENWLISQGADSNMSILNKEGKNQYSGRGMVTTWSLAFVANGEEDKLNSAEGLAQLVGNTTGIGEGKWYLVRNDEEIVDPKPDPSPNPGPKPEPPKPNDPAEMQQITNLGISATQALSFASELEDLRSRLGEVRYGAQDGAWVRAGYAKETADGYNGRGFEQKTHNLHIGLDRIVAADEDSSWLVGGALRYAKSKQEGFTAARGGEGELEQYSAKLYATYMHAQGSYADFVVQAGRYSQDLTGLANDLSSAFKADYKTYGYGASVEIGHMFDFNNQVDDRQWFNHFFIEPQLQLSYFNAHGKDYKTSTGLAVSQSDADFLTGRAGVVLGKKFNYGTADDLDKRYFQVGLKGGVKYEFLGDQTIRFIGIEGITKERKADDVDGARYYYGVTADWQLSDNFRAYATVEREEGDHYTKDFDVSVGVKYQF